MKHFLILSLGTGSLLLVTGDFSDDSITSGCLARDFAGRSAASPQEGVSTVSACKKACADSSTCQQFTLSSAKVCSLGDAPFGVYLESSEGSISGPKSCSVPEPACVNQPKDSFPASSVAESPNAWSSGYQPTNLQCWGRTDSGDYTKCSRITELESKEGVLKCDGMVETDLTGQTCEEHCKSDVSCAAWKLTAGKCFTGVGKNCFSGTGYTVEDGGRFQHGDVEVLMDLTGKKVSSLVLVFGVDSLDTLQTQERAEEACKNMCYSDFKCQYWNYVKDSGCFTEDSNHPVPYPLLAAELVSDSKVSAGQYVRRSCDLSFFSKLKAASSSSGGSVASGSSYASGSGASSGSGTESSGSGSSGSEWPWWAWMLLGLLALCCVAACVAAAMFAMKPKKPKKKRAVVRAAAPPQETIAVTPAQPTQMVYTVPQPVPTVQRELPVYQTTAPAVVMAPQPFVQQTAAPVSPTLVQQPFAPVQQAYTQQYVSSPTPAVVQQSLPQQSLQPFPQQPIPQQVRY